MSSHNGNPVVEVRRVESVTMDLLGIRGARWGRRRVGKCQGFFALGHASLVHFFFALHCHIAVNTHLIMIHHPLPSHIGDFHMFFESPKCDICGHPYWTVFKIVSMGFHIFKKCVELTAWTFYHIILHGGIANTFRCRKMLHNECFSCLRCIEVKIGGFVFTIIRLRIYSLAVNKWVMAVVAVLVVMTVVEVMRAVEEWNRGSRTSGNRTRQNPSICRNVSVT